jgi:hypothetical protein
MNESERKKFLLKIMVAYNKSKATCDAWHQALNNLKEVACENRDEMAGVLGTSELLQNEIHIFQGELVNMQASHIKNADLLCECLNVHNVLPKDGFDKAAESKKDDANTV